ncbi:MAG: ATP-NAD kinase family protein [Desulfurococcaceae archaeon]|uniref:ATP-NAD kinase n=1 Tax=Staphylothermus marinus TaxID=2280 RepID=A0A7C4NQY2_STAMA
MSKVRLGFIVNPIAGMGGAVGLKGTDGEAYNEALKRGAEPVAPRRALEFLNSISAVDFAIIVADGCMGLNVVVESRHRDRVVETIGPVPDRTSRNDTIRIAREMVGKIDLLVFVGGDGTARDIYEAVDTKIPVLGVPSGVKMFSAVFATTPRSAARVFEEFIRGGCVIVEREVLDIDEDAYRRGVLNVKLYGFLKIPVFGEMVQSSKTVFSSYNEEENKIGIAKFVIENLSRDTLLILGPGSTVKKIAELLSQPYTLMGFDAYYDGKVVGLDLSEKELFDLINRYNRKVLIVLSPIGGQGFILGRGNQQLSPRIIRIVGLNNILIVATRSKIRDLKTLRVDTGDSNLDREICRYVKVLVDYNEFITRKIVCD